MQRDKVYLNGDSVATVEKIAVGLEAHLDENRLTFALQGRLRERNYAFPGALVVHDVGGAHHTYMGRVMWTYYIEYPTDARGDLPGLTAEAVMGSLGAIEAEVLEAVAITRRLRLLVQEEEFPI